MGISGADLANAVMWLAPAFLVAGLRVFDVVVNVVKTVFVVNGQRAPAAIGAALEAGLWLAAAGIVLSDMSPARFIGYVGGVGIGTWIGMWLISKFRLGLVTVSIHSTVAENSHEPDGETIAVALRQAGFGATVFDGRGRSGPIHMVRVTSRRREAQRVCQIAKEVDPDAFLQIDNHPGPGSRIGPIVGSNRV